MSSLSSFSRRAQRKPITPVAFVPILPFLYPPLYLCSSQKPRPRNLDAVPIPRSIREPTKHISRRVTKCTRSDGVEARARSSRSLQRQISTARARSKVQPLSACSPVSPVFNRCLPRTESRSISTNTAYYGALALASREVTREDLMGMVDVFPTSYEQEDVQRRPGRRKAVCLPPVTVNQNTTGVHLLELRDQDPQVLSLVRELRKHLNDAQADNDTIHRAYLALPQPRLQHLNANRRDKLLHRLSIQASHNDTTIRRYMSVLDDFKAANLKLRLPYWNVAIHLAGRPFGTVTDSDVENALYIWKDMERRQGTIADAVTFNILLNIAIKARKFALADMIVGELEARNLKKTTAFRLGVIFCAGQQRDGEGVRKAYRKFVEADEIVTTTVLNTVLAALYTAGEFAGAEALFESMRVRYGEDSQREDVLDDWQSARGHQQLMADATIATRDDPEARQELQNRVPLRPDAHTYRIMIRNACQDHQAGDLDRVDELLEQMRERSPPLDVTADMYLSVFRGFVKFGHPPYSTIWSAQRLERKWHDFLAAYDADPKRFAFTRKLAQTVLSAFLVLGGRKKVALVWPEISRRWVVETEHKGTGRGLEDLAMVERWVKKQRVQDGEEADPFREANQSGA